MLIVCSLALLSCQSKQEECRRYRGDRCQQENDSEEGKKPRRARSRDREDRKAAKTEREDRERRAEEADEPSPAAPAKERLIFPARLKTGHSALSLASNDNSAFKMIISAEPQSLPVSLIAGLSGTVSISTNEGSHILILSSPKNNKTLYFELNEGASNLMASDSQNVSQGQVLAETTMPLVFYAKENGELTAICPSFDELEQNLKLINSFPSHPNCQQ